ncbi:MAG: hypothetical protein ACHQ53_00540 [Polyangiales bacterium]
MRMPIEAAPERRYTLCGDVAAEARVAQDLSRLATGIDSEVGDTLRALLLVGAFARAEGGIVKIDGEPCAAAPGYLLLAVFARGARRHERSLATMAATWSRLLHAEVAIRPIAARQLPHVPASRLWFHVGRGQAITLTGSPSVIAAVQTWRADALRWEEADFTLAPALTELALSALEAPSDLSRAVQCTHETALALGDALLLRRGQYAETLAARSRALETAQASAILRAAYADAITWARRPDLWRPESTTPSAWLQSTQRRLLEVHLEAEAARLGSGRDLLAYVSRPRPLHASPDEGPPGRMARTAQALAAERPELASWLTHPFERLLRAAIALGFGWRAPACRVFAAKLLHAAPDDTALAAALRAHSRAALPDALR